MLKRGFLEQWNFSGERIAALVEWLVLVAIGACVLWVIL